VEHAFLFGWATTRLGPTMGNDINGHILKANGAKFEKRQTRVLQNFFVCCITWWVPWARTKRVAIAYSLLLYVIIPRSKPCLCIFVSS